MPTRSTRRLIAGPLALAVVGTGAVALAAPAQAVSTSVVISEVYGGGGNNGATYTNDFVELYNLGTTPVDLSTWKVQYWSANGANPGNTTSLSGTIAPQSSFLIQMAAGAGGTTPLPDARRHRHGEHERHQRSCAACSTARPRSTASPTAPRRPRSRARRRRARPTRRPRAAPARAPTPTTTPPTSPSVTPSPRNSGAGPLACTPVPPDAGRARDHPPDPGRQPPLPAGGQAGQRRRGRRHRRVVHGLLVPEPHAGQRPRHQRGPVRLHPQGRQRAGG